MKLSQTVLLAPDVVRVESKELREITRQFNHRRAGNIFHQSPIRFGRHDNSEVFPHQAHARFKVFGAVHAGKILARRPADDPGKVTRQRIEPPHVAAPKLVWPAHDAKTGVFKRPVQKANPRKH